MEQIALALFTCLILAIVSKSLSLPPIPFYIIAGVLLGNSGLKIISPNEVFHFFSQLGLIFLLFYIGLELKPERIMSRGSAFMTSGLIDLNVNMLIGFFAALALGFSYYEAFVVASAFYISSSAMVIASLIENKKLILPESETVVWLMIFEDIALVFLIFIISTEMQHPFVLILKVIAVVCLLFAIVKFVKRALLKILQRDDELPVILTFSAVLSAAFISSYLGIPEVLTVIALGSALSTTNPRAFERISRPFKDVFLILFFFFFGISIDFSGNLFLMQALIISFIAIISKLLSGFLVGRTLHRSYPAGIEIGADTIGRGEFSIAIAAIYGSEIVSATVTVMVILTSIVGSFMAKYSSKIKVSLIKYI
ncbi:cation:proton antiporter [Archaeoglobales archaeon]|nr:MAG: cation:proton antiporter [Archaeoglobales archaeon]